MQERTTGEDKEQLALLEKTEELLEGMKVGLRRRLSKQPEGEWTEQSKARGTDAGKIKSWNLEITLLRFILRISVTHTLETIYILHKNYNEYLQHFLILIETRMSGVCVCVCVGVCTHKVVYIILFWMQNAK